VKDEHTRFSGSIPAAYDRYLRPILFQPYAEDLAARLQLEEISSVLELACGTGILTRILRSRLPASVKLTATDLNEEMFQHAKGKFGKGEDVQWLQADASSLPFTDGLFDAVVCQFGIMFVPDKALAIGEAYRVLKRNGLFLFNVWDAMEHNELARLTHEVVTSYFDKDPPAFYEVPFSYHDRSEIERALKKAGFQNVQIEVVPKLSGVSRARDAALGLLEGNPVAVEITERDPALLPIVTDAVAKAILTRFGESDFRAAMQAIVIQARR
jgi:ubiquinone/menaquinone biosynthesis C-methylase UbiE